MYIKATYPVPVEIIDSYVASLMEFIPKRASIYQQLVKITTSSLYFLESPPKFLSTYYPTQGYYPRNQ